MTWQDSSPAAANGADASQTFNTTNISDMSVTSTGVMQQLTHPGLPTDGHEPASAALNTEATTASALNTKVPVNNAKAALPVAALSAWATTTRASAALNTVPQTAQHTALSTNKVTCKGPKASLMDAEALKRHYHLPMLTCCQLFGVCKTYFKRVCRSHGIKRWPYRKV